MKTSHLHKLHGELSVERGHLALHAQLPSPNRERHNLIVGGAVTHSIKDVQILHHHVAVETNVKHLSRPPVQGSTTVRHQARLPYTPPL